MKINRGMLSQFFRNRTPQLVEQAERSGPIAYLRNLGPHAKNLERTFTTPDAVKTAMYWPVAEITQVYELETAEGQPSMFGVTVASPLHTWNVASDEPFTVGEKVVVVFMPPRGSSPTESLTLFSWANFLEIAAGLVPDEFTQGDTETPEERTAAILDAIEKTFTVGENTFSVMSVHFSRQVTKEISTDEITAAQVT